MEEQLEDVDPAGGLRYSPDRLEKGEHPCVLRLVLRRLLELARSDGLGGLELLDDGALLLLALLARLRLGRRRHVAQQEGDAGHVHVDGRVDDGSSQLLPVDSLVGAVAEASLEHAHVLLARLVQVARLLGAERADRAEHLGVERRRARVLARRTEPSVHVLAVLDEAGAVEAGELAPVLLERLQALPQLRAVLRDGLGVQLLIRHPAWCRPIFSRLTYPG